MGQGALKGVTHDDGPVAAIKDRQHRAHLMADTCSGPELPCELHALLVPLACHKAAIVRQRLHSTSPFPATALARLTQEQLSTQGHCASKQAVSEVLRSG